MIKHYVITDAGNELYGYPIGTIIKYDTELHQRTIIFPQETMRANPIRPHSMLGSPPSALFWLEIPEQIYSRCSPGGWAFYAITRPVGVQRLTPFFSTEHELSQYALNHEITNHALFVYSDYPTYEVGRSSTEVKVVIKPVKKDQSFFNEP